jgi:glutamate synthase domain-containing protein 2/glutamate synthase domain-containing protein 1/glutamate synthase domain-containing protein 3
MHREEVHEIDACGVGFVASRVGEGRHEILRQGLHALKCVEHRGGVLSDGSTGDGAGIMADIPFELFGFAPKSIVVASLFLMTPPERRQAALDTFERTFAFAGLKLKGYRAVPVDPSALGPKAQASMPELLHAFLERPAFCRTDASLNQLLYSARTRLRTQLQQAGVIKEFFLSSLSTTTINYKAQCSSGALPLFYDDLRNPAFKTRFCMFHRRFSTNTMTTWDKVQPFRLIAHNGEINTIRANRSWSYSREQAMGLPMDELLTHKGISDSGHFNEMTEALKYRGCIPELEDILAIMIPPAGEMNDWYRFWSRAQEPWDGPAFIAFCDGETIGGRLDRNGFRPCRWSLTKDRFFFASEAGVFDLPDEEVLAKGTLKAGTGVKLDLHGGEVHFRDPSESRENEGAHLDPRLYELGRKDPAPPRYLHKKRLFGLSREELDRLLLPMVESAKEPIGSMGDTARLAVLSSERRSFFDYFFQTFAQVTNPPLDYLREKMVTDLSTYLGKRPNIFQPKELIPPAPALLAPTPVLRLSQMEWLRELKKGAHDPALPRIRARELDCTFAREAGAKGLEDAIVRIGQEALRLARQGAGVLVLTDKDASLERPAVPSLLALRAVVTELNNEGLRLECSIVVETGDARSSHQVAALIAFGATAVCPALTFELARAADERRFEGMSADEREERAAIALEGGLLKIMSKMGISVVRSYQSSKLFCAVGLGEDITGRFFHDMETPTPIGGISLAHLAEDLLRQTRDAAPDHDDELPTLHLLREHNKGAAGERHSMTSARTRVVHELVKAEGERARELYDEYLRQGAEDEPISPRHLLELVPAERPLSLDAVEPVADVTRRFGAGAMSFGAISAESQRDIFRAMRRLGGRSNSGEGGENPFYYVDGTTATTKQVASGRFGVTAEYLAAGEEIEIKVAQGAKPGEGGQLMAVKVDEHIARARFSSPRVDLISPPPLHDIYSIEDLKQLIYELKQLYPQRRVCVKLVSGVNIGTIAAGVVKAGADVVQISGGDGGTGAATLTSMRHAGLPWELGLVEVHRVLVERGLRDHVRLRADGGMSSGKDIVMACALGADEVGFGKLLLVAEGCIMARICEKNTCPRGIATHDERFKKKYRGSEDDVVALLTHIAEDVRRQLSLLGVERLEDVVGRARLLRPAVKHASLVTRRGIVLDGLLQEARPQPGTERPSPFLQEPTELNLRLADEAKPALERDEPVELVATVRSTDRAVLARLNGRLAERLRDERMARIARGEPAGPEVPLGLREGVVKVHLRGSAGQGFGVFLQRGLDVLLEGEANDSVCKGMSGGRVVVRPQRGVPFVPEKSAILGNCALYGATGGALYVSGVAGDRFAVRNSGATAVIDGVGMHACGYMTGGTVVILGFTSHNLGSGMTGGTLYTRVDNEPRMNRDYIAPIPLVAGDEEELRRLLEQHHERTGGVSSRELLEDWGKTLALFCKYVPVAEAARAIADAAIVAA